MEEKQEGLKEVTETETESAPTGVDQPVKETEVEDIESLKARLAKEQEDKENYRKMALKYKTRSLEPETKEEKEEEVTPDWDETSKKFQAETISKAERMAEAKAQKVIEKANEKSAINQFISDNPELSDDLKWNEVVANYYPKAGKGTQQDIVNDLKRALFLTRYEKGEISDVEKNAFEKGKQKGSIDAAIANLSTVSKSQAKPGDLKESTLSAGALKLAQAMRVDPKKVADEDLSKPATINY